jgi:glycosyltransferase involved in cell wall biosynthesis
MRIAFTTHYCTHYRVQTYEMLSHFYLMDFYFYSEGKERYWLRQHGVRTGNFNYKYLPGFRIGHTRITLTLFWELWRGNYDVYIKCINGRFALPITYLVARLRRKPFILWTGIWMRLQTPAHRLFFPLTRYIYRHADAVVVYGEHVKRYLVSEAVPAERIFVAAHAVDNDVYNRKISEEKKTALRQELGIEPAQKVVLYLGRLEEIKGLPYLVKAFKSLQGNDAILLLVGTGSQRAYLEQFIREQMLVDRVRFVDYVPPEKTVLYYALAWVYVLPSITTPVFKEPWGLVVNEAFNQSVPVIATDAVGAAAGGLVQDGINGFVVPEQNSKALAQVLRCILDDPGLRERLGRNAQRIIAGWDNERMVKGFREAIAYVGAECKASTSSVAKSSS